MHNTIQNTWYATNWVVTSRHAKIMKFCCTKWWKYPDFGWIHIYFFFESTFTNNVLMVTVFSRNIISSNSSITWRRLQIATPKTYKCTTDIGKRVKYWGHFCGILPGKPPSYIRFQMQNNVRNQIMWKTVDYRNPLKRSYLLKEVYHPMR